MKLEDLVPPLEMCQQIPDGCFEDSFFSWLEYKKPDGWERNWRNMYADSDSEFIAVPRKSCERCEFYRMDCVKDRRNALVIPAPTLAEILMELPKHCDNPAASALKLWLEARK